VSPILTFGSEDINILFYCYNEHMPKITLRKLATSDKVYFGDWWRDKALLELTSGMIKSITDKEIGEYLSRMLQSLADYHFMIVLGNRTIGHISLIRKKDGWYETQIIIGDKKYWGQGYGSEAIKLLLEEAKKMLIAKIYLEVRPDNVRAIRSYEKCGFKKEKIIKYPKDEYLPETLRMEIVM
jgi:RimJ/RimL family protein N-acetyltransferase